MINRDSNSGIQYQFSGTIYRAEDLPTAKGLCNANLEYGHEAQTFKHSEPDLEALNDKVSVSVTVTGVELHRLQFEGLRVAMTILVENLMYLWNLVAQLLVFLGPAGEEP